MKTGFVTTSFPRYPGDFAGCFVEDAALACVAAGEAIEVVAAGPSTRLARPDEAPTPHPSIQVCRVTTVRQGAATPTLFFGAGAPEALEGQAWLAAWFEAGFFWAALCDHIRARAHGWNRIVAHWLVPSALAAHAVAPHLPLTAYAHSGDVALLERLPVGLGAVIGRRLVRAVADLVFVSADLRDRFARLTGLTAGRVERLVPGARPPSAGRPHDARRPTVLSVGRLVPIKGFDILLRAVARTIDSHGSPGKHALSVVILGEGPERTRLEKLARRFEIELHLPGCVSRDEVRRWMTTAADVYVQPSRRLGSGRTEGVPLATLEALQAGLPVIASRTGGLGELGGVTKVAAEDVSSLALVLAALATDPVTRRWRSGSVSH